MNAANISTNGDSRLCTCGGLVLRIPTSRLERSLGHEKFQCTYCSQKWKLAPKEKTEPWIPHQPTS